MSYWQFGTILTIVTTHIGGSYFGSRMTGRTHTGTVIFTTPSLTASSLSLSCITLWPFYWQVELTVSLFRFQGFTLGHYAPPGFWPTQKSLDWHPFLGIVSVSNGWIFSSFTSFTTKVTGVIPGSCQGWVCALWGGWTQRKHLSLYFLWGPNRWFS